MAIKTYSNLNTVDAIKEMGNFKTLTELLEIAGLIKNLSGEEPYTLFAPTDSAFSELAPGFYRTVLQTPDKQRLTDTLRLHIASGILTADDLFQSEHITSLLGENVEVLKRDGSLLVRDSEVLEMDIYTNNGIIHIIDRVLIPKSHVW